jgi:hypothetical protein
MPAIRKRNLLLQSLSCGSPGCSRRIATDLYPSSPAWSVGGLLRSRCRGIRHRKAEALYTLKSSRWTPALQRLCVPVSFTSIVSAGILQCRPHHAPRNEAAKLLGSTAEVEVADFDIASAPRCPSAPYWPCTLTSSEKTPSEKYERGVGKVDSSPPREE